MSEDLDFNKSVAKKFYLKAQAMQDKGDKYKFRAITYFKAARAIEGLDKSLIDIYKKGWLVGLQKIKGIGNRLAHEIEAEIKKSYLN